MRLSRLDFAPIFVALAACGSELDLGKHDDARACPPGAACDEGGGPNGTAGPGGNDPLPGGGDTPIAPVGILPAGGPWVEAAAGIEGGDIRSLSFDATDTKVVYAASFGAGVFRSLDGGDTWKVGSSGLGDRLCISSVVAHPGQANTVFAQASRCSHYGNTTEGSALATFRSVDRGATWTQVAIGAAIFSEGVVAPSPSSPNIVYLAHVTGIFRSTDGGVTFAPRVFPGSVLHDPSSFAVDPKNPDVAYCVIDGAAWKTVNGGTGWAPLATPAAAYTVQVSSADSLRLVSTLRGSPFVANSENGGQNWAPASGGVADVMPLLVSPSSPLRVYGSATNYATSFGTTSLFASNDGGKSFGVLPAKVEGAYRIRRGVGVNSWAIDPADSTHVILSSGLIESTKDSGATVTKATGGIMNRDVDAIVNQPSSPNVLYAASLSELHKTTNGGGAWTRLPRSWLATDSVTALAAHPTNPSVLYAAVLGYSPSPRQHRIWKSIDGGQTFQAIGTPANDAVKHLLVDPMVPSTVYAFVEGVSSVRVSRDDGVTWASAVLPTTMSLAGWGAVSFDPKDSSRIIATVDNNDSSASVVLRSTDRGATFTAMTSGTTLHGSDLFVRSTSGVLHDRKKEGSLYACLDQGVYRSTDSGNSWHVAMVGVPADAECAKIFVTEGEGHIGMFTKGGGRLYVSVDGATSWQAAKGVNPDGDFYESVKAIAVDPTNPKTVFLGLAGSVGVARTTSLGL